MKLKSLLFACGMLLSTLAAEAQSTETFSSNIVTDEGAWCWFADPRALHYENEAGTINATYMGYIDVHGNVTVSYTHLTLPTICSV